jgi:hypothetical protein
MFCRLKYAGQLRTRRKDALKLRVIRPHRSEFPDPITLGEGDRVTVGKKYEGSENWTDWYFCSAPGQKGGWVPGQFIERLDRSSGAMLEDYTAKELDVDEGDTLVGLRELNGWIWCHRSGNGELGWVPLECVTEV